MDPSTSTAIPRGEASTADSTAPMSSEANSTAPMTLSSVAGTNESGRPWKSIRPKATNRTQMFHGLKSKSWEARLRDRNIKASAKAMERELKEEKEAEENRKKEITKERKKMAEEKARLEQLAQKMSMKRLQRYKKRLSRSKKISG